MDNFNFDTVTVEITNLITNQELGISRLMWPLCQSAIVGYKIPSYVVQ